MDARELIVLGDTNVGGFARELNAQCLTEKLSWSIRDGGFDSWEREVFESSALHASAETRHLDSFSRRACSKEQLARAQPVSRASARAWGIRAAPHRPIRKLFHDPRGVLPSHTVANSRGAHTQSMRFSTSSQNPTLGSTCLIMRA